MPFSVLGLQAAIADGSEPTFDGQPMAVGTHLRWSFAPELGFPPGAFWLARREAVGDKGPIEPPEAVSAAIGAQGSPPPDPNGLGGLVTVGSTQSGEQAGSCCDCGRPLTCVADVVQAKATDAESGRSPCGCPDCDCCRCSGRAGPPPVPVSVSVTCCCRCDRSGNGNGDGGNGKGGNGGTGTGTVGGLGWGTGEPVWGPPDGRGWQVWGEPFTLPVTRQNWPARYTGALDPATHSEALLLARDVLECGQRLDGLALLAGMSAATMRQHFTDLRGECARLVQGWPAEPNYAVGLQAPADGAAPQLSLPLVSQLQLAAISPYLARVLGLYFVDAEASPGVAYDYCLVGVWAAIVPPVVRTPGSAPAGSLAAGRAIFDGLLIGADPALSHLYGWQGDGTSAVPSAALPGVPAAVAEALGAAVAPLAVSARPPALLAAQANPPAFPFPPPGGDQLVAVIGLQTPVAEVALSVAGPCQLVARSGGAEVASVTVTAGAGALQWYPLAAPAPATAPIEEILVIATGGPGTVVVIGSLVSSPVPAAKVGVRWAIVHAPGSMTAPPAPAQPLTLFRRRESVVDPSGPSIVTRSFFDVQWVSPPLTAADRSGDPVDDPEALPPPDRTVGYVAERADGDLSAPTPIGRFIAAAPQPTPADSPLQPAPAILRFADVGLPDPKAGYQHRTAGFGLFGQRGPVSDWSDPRGVERIAAPPALRLLTSGATQTPFDNSPSGGGGPDDPANPTAWVGGTLTAVAAWSGSSLLGHPDARAARLTVTTADPAPTVLATADFTVPAPTVTGYTLTQLVPDPERGVSYAITDPPLTALGPGDPSASLTLTGVLADGTTISERFAVRPGPVDPAADVRPAGVVATLPGGSGSSVVTNAAAFEGQPAYLVSGVTVPLTVPVPLSVPIGQPAAFGQASVAVSEAEPFAPGEQITDPNTGATRAEPSSNDVLFAAAQRLSPPSPVAAPEPTPTHIVDHLYYSPADFNGNASYPLPFDLSAGLPAISGYRLRRAPAHSLFLADIKRRRTAPAGLLDGNPVIAGRPDLQNWIEALPGWLAAYNHGLPAADQVTEASVLTDAAGQRALIEHFYGGLLDDELRALADVAANAAAFAQVASVQAPAPPALTDTVNGSGFGRHLYVLASVNEAGSVSAPTPATGPIYTATVNPSRAPVLYKVAPQPGTGAYIVAWALDGSPDVAGYLVYRAPDPAGLADLRWFGADQQLPSDPTTLALPQVTPGAWHSLGLTPGDGDPRLIGLVNDPRAFARDYQGSDMGEVPLPPGPPPEEILGVYRLADFDPATPQSQPGTFNYWLPGPGGTAQLVTDTSSEPAASRVIGLRLGLGRGVPVAVVARYGGVVRVIGAQPVLRAAFVDGALGPATAADPNGPPADQNATPQWAPVPPGQAPCYAVVAIDVAGNQSAPSATFTVPPLVPA
ncbi:MAG TPA: hypothetical protein VHZ33_23795 [Trebonia sp.]|nr:hypothetical protein [Trebonia sp.]